MNRIITLAGIVLSAVLVTGILSFGYAEKKYQDIFQQLGIDKEEASQTVKSNFFQGTLSVPLSSKYKMLAPQTRPAAVREIGGFIRMKIMSDEFRKEYQQKREYAKPVLPDHEQELKERIEELENNKKETETALKTATGELRDMHLGVLKMYKEELAILRNRNHPDFAALAGMNPELLEQEKEEFRASMKKFEETYPADVKVYIRKRIQQFLDLTGDIDFNATLVNRNGKKYFADRALERKESNWKLCFRAGRETIATARDFAKKWLEELK